MCLILHRHAGASGRRTKSTLLPYVQLYRTLHVFSLGRVSQSSLPRSQMRGLFFGNVSCER
jgi:hypothetical protein